MAYLSRIWLNPLRTATQRMLRDPHVMHAAVLGGIPAQPVTERVLWRIEAGDPHRAELLVLTRSVPSWEHLVEQGVDRATHKVAGIRLLPRYDVQHLGQFLVARNLGAAKLHAIHDPVARRASCDVFSQYRGRYGRLQLLGLRCLLLC